MLLAPDLIVPEVCSAAWSKLRRGEIGAEQAAAMVEGLPDLLDELVASASLAGRALTIANALAHPAYDCFYLALAEVRDVQMVTDDRRLLARLVTTPWARMVMKLGNDIARD
jgi:predicted nucleic acid-binding protein